MNGLIKQCVFRVWRQQPPILIYLFFSVINIKTLIIKLGMSFITKIGQDMEKDKKLVVMRKKYFHNILEFNQVWQQEKRETTIK
jgi:hypothetical protein